MRRRLGSFILCVTLLAAPVLAQGMAPAEKAASDFRRVDLAPVPNFRDAAACVQSHKALLLAIRLEQRYLVHYRKGYCGVFLGLVSSEPQAFRTAMEDLASAIKEAPREAAATQGIRLLDAVAKLQEASVSGSALPAPADLEPLLRNLTCQDSPVMNAAFCLGLADTLRAWTGWLAWKRGDLAAAALTLQVVDSSPWRQWVKGAQAEKDGDSLAALQDYREALAEWRNPSRRTKPSTADLLGPIPDLGAFSYTVGRLALDHKQYEPAVAALNESLEANPKNAHAVFLRAQAKDAMGLPQPALDDYALAARLAQATQDTTWPVGVAFFRRGVLSFRAGDFPSALTEFATALESPLGDVLRADVAAWRVMASVAGGACEAASGVLERSIPDTSAAFPRGEAFSLVFDCRKKQASTLEQLQQLDKQFRGLVPEGKLAAIKPLIAVKYADRGIQAEDRKDRGAAVAAYLAAIEADPRVPKAHFNLGSMYFEDRKYGLAEEQFRAIVEVNPKDYESRYWLAESILQQRDPSRKLDGCRQMQESLLIENDELRQQFARSLVSAGCPLR